jgi:hypothetical protein
MAKKLGNLIGSWAFLIGVLLALVVGVLTGMNLISVTTDAITITLICLGLLVGLFNISRAETNSFLMSGITLILASFLGSAIMGSIPVVGAVLASLLAIFVPATIIVAILNVFNLAKN